MITYIIVNLSNTVYIEIKLHFCPSLHYSILWEMVVISSFAHAQ